MGVIPTPALTARAVYDVLGAVDGLEASGIRVVLGDGVVRLRGRVASADDALVAALAIDHAFASAVEVIDELDIDPSRGAARSDHPPGSSDPVAAQRDQRWTPPDYPSAPPEETV